MGDTQGTTGNQEQATDTPQETSTGDQTSETQTPAAGDAPTETDQTPPPPVEDSASEETPPAVSTPEPDPVVAADPIPADVQDDPDVVKPDTLIGEVDEEDALVCGLNQKLTDFTDALNRPGSDPKDFVDAAKINAQIGRYIIQFPRVPVLEAYLNFFKNNLETVCKADTYLLGSQTLPVHDEQLVSTLYTLFHSLASGKPAQVDQGRVMSIMKKPEISAFYTRRAQALEQYAKQQQK